MLGDIDAIATIAVKDLAAAKRFYEGTLGLKRVDEHCRSASALPIDYVSGCVARIVAAARIDVG
jgi:predicted enzyme related to lactoylglutathione lyase